MNSGRITRASRIAPRPAIAHSAMIRWRSARVGGPDAMAVTSTSNLATPDCLACWITCRTSDTPWSSPSLPPRRKMATSSIISQDASPIGICRRTRESGADSSTGLRRGRGGTGAAGPRESGGHHEPVAPGQLRAVQRRVGLFDPLPGSGHSGRTARKTDAQRAAQSRGLLDLQVRDARADAVRHHLGGGHVGPAQHGAELVAAITPGEVALAQADADDFAHLPDYLIAYRVTELVVDALEAIDVDQQHHGTVAAMPLEHGVHRLFPVAAVQQPAQRIDAAQPEQLAVLRT